MINFRFIANLMGRLLLIESAFLLLCVLIALIYGEHDASAFFYTSLITMSAGFLLSKLIKIKDRVLAKKDGYFMVTMVWIIFSLFGSLPYMIGNTIPSFADAFFETMSGFTTTGLFYSESCRSTSSCHLILAFPDPMAGRIRDYYAIYRHITESRNRGTGSLRGRSHRAYTQ